MKAWEYRVETINTEYLIDEQGDIDNSPSGPDIIQSVLKSCGQEGWEAVAFVPAAPERHFKGHVKNPWVFHVIFKRPVTS